MVTTMDWLVGLRYNDSATGWGGEPTVVAYAALDGLLLLTESMPRGFPTAIADENIGEAHSRVTFKPEVDVAGGVDALARYEGIEKLLAYTFGDNQAAVASATDITKFDFLYAWQDKLDGIAETMFIHPGIANAYRYRNVKLLGFELRVQEGLIAYTPTIIGDVVLRDVADGPLGKAVVTMPTIGLGIAMRHLNFRMNDSDDIALAVGDEQDISDFTLSVQRQLEGDHGNQPDGAVFEPRETGQSIITLSVTSPVYDAAWDAFMEKARLWAKSWSALIDKGFKNKLGRDEVRAHPKIDGSVNRMRPKMPAASPKRGAASSPSMGGSDMAKRLTTLKGLRDKGLISASEYETKKAEILKGL